MAAALCARSCVQKIQSAGVCRTIVRRTLPYIDQWRLPTCSAHFSIFPAGTHAESATFQGRTLSAHFLHGRTLGPLCPARWMTNHTHFDGQKNSELHQAAREDRIDDVKKILAQGGTDPSAADSKGMTALHYAAQADHKMILQVLLEGGANPNAQNSDGRTPLHLCMPAGFSACVVHLYNAGADDTIKDRDGKTALDQTSEDFSPANL